MNKTIDFYVKNVYGNETQYYADPQIEQIMQGIAGVKTITPAIKHGLTRLGFEFKMVFEPKIVVQDGKKVSYR